MRRHLLTMVLVTASACLNEVHAASFQGLGFLPGDSSSMAFDVSPDGSAVVGGSTGTVTEAFRWTFNGGMTGLGHLPDHEDISWGYGVSADGEVVVGMCGHGGTYGNAFRWTAETGMVDIGGNSADDLSADGSVVVGWRNIGSGIIMPFRWTEAGGMATIPERHARPLAASADGAVIVGYTETEVDETIVAFRWAAETGVFRLGAAPRYVGTRATAVSADGSVIVGWGETCHGQNDDCDPDTRVARSFFWTEGEGFVELGAPPGDYDGHTYAAAASADASIIVGAIESPSGLGGAGAFVWDADHGVRYLEDVLTADFGLDLAGWELVKATGISDDGRVIVGYGYNPSGVTEAWRAVVPEPSSFVLLSVGAVVLLIGVRRKRRLR